MVVMTAAKIVAQQEREQQQQQAYYQQQQQQYQQQYQQQEYRQQSPPPPPPYGYVHNTNGSGEFGADGQQQPGPVHYNGGTMPGPQYMLNMHPGVPVQVNRL
jgi:type II secretory pathway pseudopilin PulG